MHIRSTASLLALALATVTVPAFAADLAADGVVIAPTVVEETGWRVTLKATGVVQPKFEGVDEYGVSGFPGLSIRRPGQPWKFGAPDDGFGFALFDSEFLQFGPVGRLRSERNSSEVNKLRGLHDVDWGIEPGVFLEVYPTHNIRVRGELRYGVTGHDGFVGDIAADWIERQGPWTLSVGPRIALGDSDFMNEYFGVTNRDSVRTGLSRYKAKGGVKSVGVAGAATYDWTQNWSTTVFGGYNRLVSDAADSPIVKRAGSKDQFTVGLGVAYSFNVDW
ncbi:MipA/OmpV family protein [Methylopila sp. Yamaguchi]|uniref:MipA/OmpV family protein n=1 Tax=Methylopila sp. Yamaguchi TaxID=1437817 RepID=UPI000CCA837D|nr:MipA/OmpV family protein [Methylopila sp. Yamaguchi]GBD47866.1 MltA-interacting MipA family protein [Methylopila sp. Yamaguchi]